MANVGLCNTDIQSQTQTKMTLLTGVDDMADIEKVIKGLECCYCNFPKTMDCNNCPYDKICYHDKACSLMLRDALQLLKEYKKHLQNDLENLNKKKLQVVNKINCTTQTERLCRYSEDNNRLPNRDDCNPLGCDACSYYRVGT